MRWIAIAFWMLAGASIPAFAQDSKAWLESQGLEAVDSKSFNEFEAVVARPKGGGEQHALIFGKGGKPAWQSNPKETDPGSKWTIQSIGRDLAGNGQPTVHFSSNTGGANCCTTHHVYQLKPQVKRLAVYSAGSMGGGDFIEVPGRKAPVMVSADDSSANAFAPYANSYFPLLILEVGPKGRLQFAQDLMQSRLPGQPPPVCAQPLASANPWLKERCAEYTSARRQARTAEIKSRLNTIKANRSADKLKWEDYFENGVLAGVSAEINRYTYTGHGAAGFNWLETVWPGNDAVKAKFVATLRQTQAKSVFAEDLKSIATN
ncbi:MAG TPA: hypothetical protein VF309_03240 [Usitatibacter sp.]